MNNIKHGPIRKDGLPSYVVWNGEQYETPDFEQIREWVYDSLCETLEGDIIEPDGHCPNGCPSWLIALGLI